MLRKLKLILTKIIATTGPASSDVDTLVRMIESGVRVVRINFSHGSFEDFEQRLTTVREAAKRSGKEIGVLGDLCGPKIRVNQVLDDQIIVADGERVEFTSKDVISQRYEDTATTVLSTSYPQMIEEAQVGERVLIDDGYVRMLVVEKPWAQDDQAYRLSCRVTHGGSIKTRKGINLPDTNVQAPSMTDYDKACARWAIEHDLEFLALSFVRKAADLHDLKSLLRELKPKGQLPPIIAKVEKPQAVDDIKAICDEADAIMVARGDLGVEMDLAEVPIIQKKIIRIAHDYSKPVIVATQMFQSMIEESSPTRAEVSDVANAILDGADAIMLSGETAVGKHPLQSIIHMARVAEMTEAHLNEIRREDTRPPAILRENRYRTAALAHAVSVLVNDMAPKFVVSWSELGGGARYLSQNRLPIAIIAISSNRAALRRMSLLYGVMPVYMDRPRDSNSFLEAIDHLLIEKGWCESGDPVVVVKGEPLGRPGVTNQVVLHYIGDIARLGWHTKANEIEASAP